MSCTPVDKQWSLFALRALLEDVKRELPTANHVSLHQDLLHLEYRYSVYGLSVIMDDLPKLGKIFDKGLSSGHIDLTQVPKSIRGPRGVLFQALLFQSFRRNGECIADDPVAVQLFRCICYLYKKVEIDASDKAKSIAIDEFVSVDRGVRTPTLDWVDNDFDPTRAGVLKFSDANEGHVDRRLLGLLEHYTRWICPQSRYIDWDDWRPKHGPGAVSDVPSGGDKYSFPTWHARLARVFPSNGWASHLHDCSEDSLPETWGRDDVFSKLKCVPKTLSKPRIIASEPTANQYCQQAIMAYLRHQTPLGAKLISYDDQQRSGDRAILASRDGLHATVDLSAASDRLSCWVVERFFRSNPDLLSALQATRTPYCEVPGYGVIPLQKFAAMGSAVTFPVQSMVYAAAACAAVAYTIGLDSDSSPVLLYNEVQGDVCVFGDDIILPTQAVDSLTILLTYLGLKVNDDKTHTSGRFRESCGTDAFMGHVVNPVYLSDIDSKALDRRSRWPSWVEVSNNAYTTGLWCLADYMVSSMPRPLLALLPICRTPMGCVRLFTYSTLVSLPRKRKWQADVQHLVYRCLTVKSVHRVEGRNSWSDLLQYFIEGAKTNARLAFLDPAIIKVGYRFDYVVKVATTWVAL